MKSFKKNIYRTLSEDTVLCPDCTPNDVTIGSQIWTGCNSVVSTYRDGTIIPYQVNSTLWGMLTTGAWCYVNNDPSTELKYGKLYNWYAVAGIYDAASLANPALRKEFAPAGYHVPTNEEWTILSNELGGDSVAGGSLKQTGLCNWWTPNTGATNSSGFSAIPIGWRDDNGNLYPSPEYSYHWTSTLFSSVVAYARRLSYNSDNLDNIPSVIKAGYAVRFIKDAPVSCPDITIGTQIWTGCNLDVTTYRNGDPIPEVTDPSAWAGLTTGAWCYYNNDSANGPIYGKLYNWYAVNDPRGLAPLGYHVPTDAEWTILTSYLGGNAAAGGAMKESGTLHWQAPNILATNTSLFTGLPGGFRNGFNGNNNNITSNGYWWSSTQNDPTTAWMRSLSYSDSIAYNNTLNKNNGYSVRLIKD